MMRAGWTFLTGTATWEAGLSAALTDTNAKLVCSTGSPTPPLLPRHWAMSAVRMASNSRSLSHRSILFTTADAMGKPGRAERRSSRSLPTCACA